MIQKEQLNNITDTFNADLAIESAIVERLIISAYLEGRNTTVVSLRNEFADSILNQLTIAGYRYHHIEHQGKCDSVRELYDIEIR